MSVDPKPAEQTAGAGHIEPGSCTLGYLVAARQPPPGAKPRERVLEHVERGSGVKTRSGFSGFCPGSTGGGAGFGERLMSGATCGNALTTPDVRTARDRQHARIR